MIEQVSKQVEVFTLTKESDIFPAVEAVIEGKISIIRIGSVYSFLLNPYIYGLAEKFNLLKDRQKIQTMSLVCSYEQAMNFVDKNRVNKDFFKLSPYVCSRMIVRIPIDTTIPLPFSYNFNDDTVQFLDFESVNPIRKAFQKELFLRGCEYLSITSGNIHSAPTVNNIEDAKELAALFNIKAYFLGMNEVQTVVTDIPSDKHSHEGSYIIVSFCNPDVIEVKRLANKTDLAITEQCIKELFSPLSLQSPIIYSL